MKNLTALKLYAPVSGHVIPIEKVPDPVFAQKLVGNGVAIDPTTQVLLAPCDGEIIQLHSSHHALTIATENGAQVLLHIGLDTVQLKGKGFRPKIALGARVKAGQALIEFDADLIVQNGKSLITIMVVTGDTPIKNLPHTQVTAGKDPLIEVSVATARPNATKTAAGEVAQSPEVRVELPTGLHARPAALLANLAKTFPANIELITATNVANAKSVVGLLGLEISGGQNVRFFAEGPGASQAVLALAAFLGDLREELPTTAPAPAVNKNASPPVRADRLIGIGISPGVAIGHVHQLRRTAYAIVEISKKTPAEERTALRQAIQTSVADLQILSHQVKSQTDATQASIFSAHQELIEDPDILELAEASITENKTAAFAWNQAITVHAGRLAKLNNELMASRANDLRDVGGRVLRQLVGAPEVSLPSLKPGSIVIAEDLTPSQTVQLDPKTVVAFATVSGGATSHVAILARALGIPALAGVQPEALQIVDGTEIVIDADQGEILLNPSAKEKQRVATIQKQQHELREAALTHTHSPAITRDGQHIEVAANIGSVADAKEAVAMGADGIGLLRSEFLFLEREKAPSEDEQLWIYQQIADALGAKPLIIRTLDVGGDKPLQYLPIPKEENPFLGIRGIRVGLLYQDILRTQLRAILRVKGQAEIHIMFPMISTLEELRLAKAILEEERQNLKAQPVKVGIMVEVPSVALIADRFAGEVDFFSIGTNDLTQYTLAMDRGHKDLAKQADALHPGVLKLIELTCKAAEANGRWVGVCGGLAGDSKAVAILLGLGVRELSVSIPSLPLIKSQVRECTITEARQLSERALNASSAEEVRSLTIEKKNNMTQGFENESSQNVVLVPTENR